MKKNFILLLPLLIFGMSLAGCHGTTNPDTTPAEEGEGEGEGGGQQGDKDKTVAVTSVVLDLTSITLEINGTQQLYASVNPTDATDKTVTWSSSASGVATVNNGLVKGVSAGKAVITATAGGKSATCNVTVNEAKANVVGIEATYSGGSIEVGSTVKTSSLTVKKVLDNNTKKELTSAEYATLHFYQDENCEHEVQTSYVFQDEDIGQHNVYVKFDTFVTYFSIQVIEKQPEPVKNYILVGESETKNELVLNESATLADGQIAEYKINDLVIANDDEEIKFYLNETLVTKFGADADDVDNNIKNNGYGDDVTENKVCISKAGTVDIYLKVYEDGGTSYWVTGGEELHYYGLVGSFTEESKWSQDIHMSVQGGIASVEQSLKQGDEFKVRVDKDWTTNYGGSSLDITDPEIAPAFSGTGDNVRVKADGNYIIKLNVKTGKIDIAGEITGDLPQTVQITFTTQKEVEFGDSIAVVGDFSNWKLEGAFVLSWTDGHIWTGTFDLEVGITISYKFVIVPAEGDIVWESGANRTLEVTTAQTIEVSCTWE